MDHTACLCAPFHPKVIEIDHNQSWNERTQQLQASCEVVMDFNSRMLCTCILDHMLYMETTSQVLVVRHSMVSVDPSRGGNYNVVTTSRLFFTQLSYILFRVVSEWQTETCITWVITWSMEATNEFSPDPLTLWLYFAPWTVWIYLDFEHSFAFADQFRN